MQKWIECIKIQSADMTLAAVQPLIDQSVSCNHSPGLEKVEVFVNEPVTGHMMLLFFWDASPPQPSLIGLGLAKESSKLGIVSHTLWIHIQTWKGEW